MRKYGKEERSKRKEFRVSFQKIVIETRMYSR